MDLALGENVDVVVADPYQWDEFQDGSFDAVVCSQVFEHVQYFWITACEMARVLKSGGLCCIIVPSAGEVHRYPYDCWRFYPDGLPTVMEYVGLTVLESYRQRQHLYRSADGDTMRDACIVARKPELSREETTALAIRDRLNGLMLKKNLTLADLHSITVSESTLQQSEINERKDRQVFANLEQACIGQTGNWRRKASAINLHLGAIRKIITRPI